MQVFCVLMIAQICLPAETQRIEVVGHIFGGFATTRIGGVDVHIETSTDEIGEPADMKQACEQDACIRYHRSDTLLPGGAIRLRYEFGSRWIGAPSVSLEGPKLEVEKLVDRLGVRPANSAAVVPLAKLNGFR